MLKTVAIVVVVLILGVLGFAATRPDSFSVQRSATVKAPPDKVFPLLEDLHRWAEWSPWEKKDPAMKRTFSGPASGVGAAYAWDGNKEVGQGRMEITGSQAPAAVTIKLDFIKPFEGHNVVEFRLAPQGDSTQVVWTMNGPAPFITKLMSTFFDMDKMIGKDFEAGLTNLKAVVEK
jgi:uncharacterized protein YndB with AHSA1/START domain